MEAKISEQQRKFFLKEQLKSIQTELGFEKDSSQVLIGKYQQELAEIQSRIEKDPFKRSTLNPLLVSTIEDECSKLVSLEKSSPEYNLGRVYLDWLTSIPWGMFTNDNFNLLQARKVLDEDHYGLDKIKSQILENIAVGNLKGNMDGLILCLVGPPGTGKTSICSSIARALDRKFARYRKF